MANAHWEELKRPLPLALALLAALGWAIVVILAMARAGGERDLRAEIEQREAARAEVAAQLDQHRQVTGELDEARNLVMTTQGEVEGLTAQRDALQTDVTALQQTLGETQRQAEESAAQQAAAQAQLEEASTQLAAAQEDLARVQQQLGESSNELATVGQRLEQARGQEAQVRQAVAELTDEAARLSQQAAETEQLAQQAREAHAQTQSEVEAARAQYGQLQAEQASLDETIAALRPQYEQLVSDLHSAEEQRAILQAQVAELAQALSARTDELAALEQRILETQQQQPPVRELIDATGGAAQPAAQEAAIEPGHYVSGGLQALFTRDGRFRLSQPASGRAVEGRYSVSADSLTLDEASGDLGAAAFPMSCRIEPMEGGFRLVVADPSCQWLDGATFER